MPHGWRMLSARRIQKGDLLCSAIVVRLNKYYIENERIYFMGRPT